RLVPAVGERVADAVVLREGVIPTQVDAVELAAEEDVEQAVLLLPQQVVGAEAEEREAILRREVVGEARLVVAVVELGVLGDEGDDGGGVRVAAAELDGSLAVREAALDERAGVEDADVSFAVPVEARGRGLAGDDAARVATEARGVTARVEVDV